jgi:hypothetical protein
MSEYHDYRGVIRMDFDCAKDSRKEVIVQLPTDPDAKYEQPVCCVVFTEEGIVLDFFEDGELVRSLGRTYQEWFDVANE